MPDHKLSDDARSVAGAWFGMMRPGGTSELRFMMVEHRPSPRAQAGLDELVKAGIVTREDEASGAVVYRPLVSCREHLAWGMQRGPSPDDFRLVDRVTPGKRPLKCAGFVKMSPETPHPPARGRGQSDG